MGIIKYFKALSDGTRMRILNLLIRNELNVNEITEILDMGQSRISRHLKILTDCDLLSSRRDGLWVFYSAARSGRGFDFINALGETIKEDPELKIDLKRMELVLEEAVRKKTEYFDSIASRWDHLKKDITGNLNLTDEIISRMRKCNTGADLGCGTGDLLLSLTDKADTLIGVDKSSKMLEEVQKKSQAYNGRLDLRLGEIEHLPMRDSEVEFAVMNMVLHHVSSPATAVSEANRILKTGGHLIILDLDKHTNEIMRDKFAHRWLGFSRPDIEEWLSVSGFKIMDFEQFNARFDMKINLYSAEKIKDTASINNINNKEIKYDHESNQRNN